MDATNGRIEALCAEMIERLRQQALALAQYIGRKLAPLHWMAIASVVLDGVVLA